MITLMIQETLTMKFGKIFDDVKALKRQNDSLNKTTTDLQTDNVKLCKRIDELETYPGPKIL